MADAVIEGNQGQDAEVAEEEAPAAPATKICPYCMSEIPIAATRCAYCTSELPAEDTDKEE